MERQRSRAERLNKGCDVVSESLGDARHRESESTGNYEEKHSALPLSQPFNFETTFGIKLKFHVLLTPQYEISTPFIYLYKYNCDRTKFLYTLDYVQ